MSLATVSAPHSDAAPPIPASPLAARRVLLLVENGSVPSDRRVWNIARSLLSAGCEVAVVCPQGTASERALSETREGVQIHRYPLALSAGGLGGYAREYATALWRTRQLVRSLTRERAFDVVHACNPPDFLLLAARPARRAGARLVFDHHDLTPELLLSRFGSKHRWLHRAALVIERACLAMADVVIATNDSYREVASGRGRRQPDDVFVVRNGPSVAQAHAPQPDAALKRGKALLIGYLGIMGPQDGVDHALRALARLARRRDDWHAIFAGRGDARAELEALSVELGISERVEFVGWLDDEQIQRLLATADVCIEPAPPSPLNDVSTMMKIAEYMAASRAIVAQGLRESRLTAGEAALYADAHDVGSFAACIEQLLDDPARREAMGRTGRERVEREFSWEHSERNLLAAYASALDPRRR